MNYLILMTMFTVDTASLSAIENDCTRLEVSNTNLRRPKGTDSWFSFVCHGVEGRQVAVLISPAERTSRGNCVYRSVVLGRKVFDVWESATYQDSAYMISRQEGSDCPNINSDKYAPVNSVHDGDDVESVYIEIINQLKNLSSRRPDVEAALSSAPLFEKLFSLTYRDFEKFIAASSESGGLFIEVIDRDFRGSGYLVLVRAGNEVWTLTFSKEEDGLRITDVSKNII